jgi:hypothetical protein
MSSDGHLKQQTGKRLLLTLLLLGPIIWSAAALWYDGPASSAIAGLIALCVAGSSLMLLAVSRSPWNGAVGVVIVFGVVLGWWIGIEPRNDRHWQPDVAELPTAEVTGDRITVHNVRNFEYRSETDFTPRWESRTYDLTKIQGFDLFLSYWGPRAIAHTILSWQFDGAPPLAVSIETRKQQGEDYSAIGGFFRQYELYYVVADERDLIRLRTNFRREDVYLYRLRTPTARARALLLDYLAKVNRLAHQPDWYNAFTRNCTTTIFLHVRDLGIPFNWDWKMFLNGYIDEELYAEGVINTTLPFDQLRARSAISSIAKGVGDQADFSSAIRAGLPDRPPPPAL